MATFKNTSLGLRGIVLRNGEYVWLEPGESRDMATAAIKRLPGGIEQDGKAPAESETAEPGPLDGSVPELTEHVAALDDPDAVQKLIDEETAGKTRKGALAILEARRDELLA